MSKGQRSGARYAYTLSGPKTQTSTSANVLDHENISRQQHPTGHGTPGAAFNRKKKWCVPRRG